MNYICVEDLGHPCLASFVDEQLCEDQLPVEKYLLEHTNPVGIYLYTELVSIVIGNFLHHQFICVLFRVDTALLLKISTFFSVSRYHSQCSQLSSKVKNFI